MTALTSTPTRPGTRTGPDQPLAAGRARPGARLRRLRSLARSEFLLLLRNRTMLVNALLLAPAMVGVASGGLAQEVAADHRSAVGTEVLVLLVGVSVAVVLYYNLTTAYVARREELLTKRMLTGETTLVEVLAATAVPAVAVALAHTALGLVAVALWFETPPLGAPLLALLALLGGTAVFAVLALATAGRTRSVEAAQLTTLPVLVISTALSGTFFPTDLLPGVLADAAPWSPLQPVVTLMRLGLGDAAAVDLGDAVQPLGALLLWAVLGAVAARRWLRIEPRS